MLYSHCSVILNINGVNGFNQLIFYLNAVNNRNIICNVHFTRNMLHTFLAMN